MSQAPTTTSNKNNKDNNEIVLESARRRRPRRSSSTTNQMNLDTYTGSDWGERLSFTVGMSYLMAASFGIFKGLYSGIPKKLNLPRKLLLNNFVNSVGKETARFGNHAAAASLLYYLTGSGLNLFFEDELLNFSNIQKNILCGCITGGIFKSTLGVIPACVGTILGGVTIGSLTYVVQFLNQKNIVSFEMKY